MRKNKCTISESVEKQLKSNSLSIALFMVFLVVSFLYICPEQRSARSQFHSSQLKKITITSENIERTDYVDSNGLICIAANLGYATIIVTKTEISELEAYLDDNGKPISRYNGYYAVLREYDNNGNNIRISYLDINHKPMIMANGYAIEEREYNERKQVIKVTYYDEVSNPVRTPSYGYGKINEYDENGNNIRITYINASGAPMMTVQGYAIVNRNFYCMDGPENGKVESEFYFDENGNPVSLSLGQYGVHKEYDENGRESVLTYLDAEGNPIVTMKGYTTILRTFHANNSIATERYFDIEGNPYSLLEGQYGIKIENGQTTYLTANGVEYFNLRTMMYNQSGLVVLFSLVLVLLSVFQGKRMNLFFLFIYLLAIAYMTLLFRENGGGQLRLELFWSYRTIMSNSENRADILKNIWLFIPLGAILYRLYPKKIVLIIPIAISILIEVIQYITGTGICELDDVISNGLGGIIGYQTSNLLVGLKQYYVMNKHCTMKQKA